MDTAREAAGPTWRNSGAFVLRFAGFTVDFPGMSLRDDAGREVALRRSEFALLRMFLNAPGRVLGREFLLDAVAGRRAAPFDRSIDVLVGRLRSKIEADPRAPRLIQTVIGVGYKFTARPMPPTAPPSSEAAPIPVPRQPPPAASERRQVTVLRCVLDGFGEIVGRLEPEDLHNLLGLYRRCCGGIVERHRGHNLNWVGDELVALFGYPEASEHAAERAVRAGLALVDAIARLEATGGQRLAARAAIATGSVLIAESLAPDMPECLGEAPVLAQRLLAAAAPGGVAIAGATQALMGGLFDTRPLPGDAADSAGVLVLGESGIASRFAALRGALLTPLVGREEELALLRRRWDQARAGAGRLVLLGGEPGIGKSRLLAELGRSLPGEAPVTVSCFCSPHHRESAYYPILRHLEHAARFARGDDATVRVGKLGTLLAPFGAEPEAVALLADALSVPTEAVLPPLALSPHQRRDRFIAALLAQTEHLARRRGLLILFEDLHWIDPSSQEVLDALIARIADLPVLLVATYRPEFAPPWASLPHTTTLLLTRLPDADAAQLVTNVAAGLDDTAARGIVGRAEGVPLFLEELARAAAEDDGAAVPASLRDSLTARLDRLPAAKGAAQLGSVIGRSFSQQLVEAISDAPAAAALDGLVASGLASRRGTASDAVYCFKHALVQEAAYASLPKDRRAAVHARIVEALIAQESAIEDSQPELLAQHCEQAGLIERAAAYATSAGWRSNYRAAYREASEQFANALRLAATLPAGATRDLAELRALRGGALTIANRKGYATLEFGSMTARAAALCERQGCPPEYGGICYGLAVFHTNRSDLPGQLEAGARLSRWGEAQNDIRGRILGHMCIGRARLAHGDLKMARTHLETAHELFSTCQHDPAVVWTYRTTMSRARAWGNLHSDLAHLWCWMGYPERALAFLSAIEQHTENEVVAVAGPLDLGARLRIFLFLSETSKLAALAGEMFALSREHRLPLIIAIATIMRGYLIARGGDPATGRGMIGDGIAAYAGTGAVTRSCWFLALLAETHRMMGESDTALRILAESLEQTERTGENWFDAELHRRIGELHTQRGKHAAAANCFDRALAVARAQGAKLWELQAATSYAGLLQELGKPAEATALLAPVYAWFTEGFDAVPLRQARALLEELAGPGSPLSRERRGTRLQAGEGRHPGQRPAHSRHDLHGGTAGDTPVFPPA